MLGSAVSSIAFGALAAQALIIPSDSIYPVQSESIESRTQSLKLPCPECLRAVSSFDDAQDDADTSLLLGFALDQDRQTLSLNGAMLYPPTAGFAKATLQQIPSSESLVDAQMHPNDDLVSVTADSVFIAEEIITEQGDAAIHLTYQIFDLDDRPVSLSAARVSMLKTSNGELQLLEIAEVAEEPTIETIPSAPEGVTVVDCHGLPLLLCKIKANIADKISSLKAGCGGMWDDSTIDDSETDAILDLDVAGIEDNNSVADDIADLTEQLQNVRHKPTFDRIRSSYRMNLRRFVRGALMVLIPIMAGFTIGMTVSVFGMLIGRLVSFMWIKYVRGGKRGYASVDQYDDDDAKTAYPLDQSDDVEDLPRYEEAPAYTPVPDSESQKQ